MSQPEDWPQAEYLCMYLPIYLCCTVSGDRKRLSLITRASLCCNSGIAAEGT